MTDDSDSGAESGKNWNFPKLHLLGHGFDDIPEKGVSSVYNTKPNEKMHGLIRKIYQQRTNFKDVTKQVSFLFGKLHNFY
jgi:hypothetical protein